MLDRDKIHKKLEIIKTCLNRLENLSQADKSSFLSDFRLADAAKHNIQAAIEAMIDTVNHIIARNGFQIPASHAEAFSIVAREGWLSFDHLDSYTAMTRFRNRVVHLYDDVDDSQVYRILQENLGDPLLSRR